jgi:hypothetical protein
VLIIVPFIVVPIRDLAMHIAFLPLVEEPPRLNFEVVFRAVGACSQMSVHTENFVFVLAT